MSRKLWTLMAVVAFIPIALLAGFGAVVAPDNTALAPAPDISQVANPANSAHEMLLGEASNHAASWIRSADAPTAIIAITS